MTKIYEVTIRPLGRENFDLAAAYAAAAAPSVEGDQGQIGAYWRWTATARPELPPHRWGSGWKGGVGKGAPPAAGSRSTPASQHSPRDGATKGTIR